MSDIEYIKAAAFVVVNGRHLARPTTTNGHFALYWQGPEGYECAYWKAQWLHWAYHNPMKLDLIPLSPVTTVYGVAAAAHIACCSPTNSSGTPTSSVVRTNERRP